MKQKRPVYYCLFSLILLACLVCLPPASTAEAATAQEPPVAQKKPVAKPKPKAQAKVAPRQSTTHLTSIEKSAPRQPAEKKGTASNPAQAKTANSKQATSAKAPAAGGDKLKNSLDVFAKGCITSMNKQRRPGINQKEVKKQADGTYMARYMAVDPDSLETRYKPTENKVILYIGHMNYHEVEYVCVGKSKEQALAGPFNETNREPITELVKYKAGKWTY